MLTEELQIFKDTQNLCKMLLQYQADIPKCIKFGEYGNAITYSFNIINDLHSISLIKDAYAKSKFIRNILINANCIKSRISVFTDMKYIQIKRATNILLLVDKIQKQCTGWINSLK